MQDGFGLFVLVVAAPALLTAGLLLLLWPLLVRYALARPNFRSSHTAPTPQGGGIAVIAAALAVSAIVLLLTHRVAELEDIAAPFGAAILLALLGAVDDVRALPAGLRLVLHAVAVSVVLSALPPELRVFPALPVWAERALLLLGGIWIVNLVNFMDGIDWMTVAEFVPVLAGLVVIGLLGALPDHATLVALALLGALLGFAPFNRPVARLFLGDVGSLPLGLLLGWMLVLAAGRGYVVAALILPLYYFADATITLIRRILDREPVWQAHRTHFYQRATNRGFTVPQVVRKVFITNLALAILAISSTLMVAPLAQAVALALAGGLVASLLIQFIRGPTK